MPWGSHSYSIHTFHAVLLVVVTLVPTAAAAQSSPTMPRVRSEDPQIAQLIADAPAMSATFRDLVLRSMPPTASSTSSLDGAAEAPRPASHTVSN